MALLSNFDIIDIFKALEIPLVGVFQKDQLPKNKQIGYYIINMQSSTDGNGTHWVLLCNIPDKNFYYDSFGSGPPQIISKYMKSDKYYINDTRLQSELSIFCGWYCIAVAYYTFNSKSKDIEKTVKSFNKMFNKRDFKKNYNKMISYFNKIFSEKGILP